MMRHASLLALCGAVAACAVGPNFNRPSPPASEGYGSAMPAADWSGAKDASQQFLIGGDIPAQWWTLFQSPELNRMVEQALNANADVSAAQAALRQSHELYLAQRATLLPSVTGGFSGARSKFPAATLTSPATAPNTTYSLYTTQLTVTYVPDVFGGTRRAVELARSQEAFSRWQLEATYLSLSSNVVVGAVQEASLRAQIAATRRLLELQRELTQKLEGQRRIGTVSELDLLSQRNLEAQTAQLLPPLEKQLGQTRDGLTALLGRLPAEEPAEQFELQSLSLPSELPISLPSRLIEQRPDVRQAEENLHAASASVGIALNDLLPQFAINADLGSSALSIGKLFGSYTEFWDLGASLTQTLFDSGALLHKKRAADAALDAAAAQYREAVILACRNVADALRAIKVDADALQASEAGEKAATQSFELARQQQRLGSVSMVALLNAEQNVSQAQLATVQARANRLSDTAALFQALGGGGWNGQGALR